MKEILEKLVFSCPRCNKVKRNYNEINKHAAQCNGVDEERLETDIENFEKADQNQMIQAPGKI